MENSSNSKNDSLQAEREKLLARLTEINVEIDHQRCDEIRNKLVGKWWHYHHTGEESVFYVENVMANYVRGSDYNCIDQGIVATGKMWTCHYMRIGSASVSFSQKSTLSVDIFRPISNGNTVIVYDEIDVSRAEDIMRANVQMVLDSLTRCQKNTCILK